jgi:O-antigen/teichoic acid export membrane protein
MTSVVMLFLSLVNGYGFANAVIQRAEVERADYQRLFGILIAFNALLAILQVALAPLAAAYYREPMVADLLRVQALLYPTTPLIVLGYAILCREMDFRRQAKVNLVSAVLVAVSSLAGALSGLGVWTLIIAPLVSAWARAIGMVFAARAWMWPRFDLRNARWIFNYGGFVLIGQLFWFVQSQADIFIVGRYYDAAELGIYSTALFLTQLFVTKVVPPLNEVAFSAYSRIAYTKRGVGPAFLRSLQMIMLVGLPVFAGFAVTARPLVLSVLGEKWAGTIPFVILLAVAMPLKTVLTLFGPAANAIDRPDIPTRNSIAGAIILPAAFLFSLQWGLIGIAWAWIAGYALLVVLAAYWTLPVLRVRAREAMAMLAPALLGTLAMAAVVIVVDAVLPPLPPFAELLILSAIGAGVYAGWLLVFARAQMREVIALIRGREAAAAPAAA